jgi:hypothetical protein
VSVLRQRRAVVEARAILSLVVVLAVFNVVIFPAAAARIAAGSGAKPLDLLLAYSPATAYSMLSAYGVAGRNAYRLTELTIDVLYPLAYSSFFWLVLRFVVRRLGLLEPISRSLTMLPFVVLGADLLENVFVLFLLARFPSHADNIALAASVVGTIKWLLFGLMVLLATVGGIAALSFESRARSRLSR